MKTLVLSKTYESMLGMTLQHTFFFLCVCVIKSRLIFLCWSQFGSLAARHGTFSRHGNIFLPGFDEN